MKQVTQNYRTGELKVEDVPAPVIKKGGILVRTAYSLISAGTERDTLTIASKSLLEKAQSRPDLVQKVLNAAKKEGIVKTYQIVTDRLNTPVALGYSLSGQVIEVAADVEDIVVGDRVACAGAGYASHAEIAFVPKHLCARIPEQLSLEHAAFSTLGAISLHAVRQSSLSIGDRVGIIGLGLLGLLTMQICKVSGCSVVGIDLGEGPVHTAEKLGIDLALLRNDPDLERKISQFTQGLGLDRIIIAAGTDSKDPFLLSGELLRDRGKLVILGGIRMEVVRTISSRFYEKEIEIRLTRSYGPGRYDREYEEKGHDYPVGYVRWTEQRNLSCFLDLLAQGKIQIEPLITNVIPIEQALDAYELIQKGTQSSIAVLLSYPEATSRNPLSQVTKAIPTKSIKNQVGVGMIGAGNFARTHLLPHLAKDRRVLLSSLMTSTGMHAHHVARHFGFLKCQASVEEILADPQCDLLIIATRHDSHAHYVQTGLQRGKIVYVEKPLATSKEQLQELWKTTKSTSGNLMVGYNRRFAPFVQSLKDFFRESPTPLTILYRVNAGYIPPDHWYQDPAQGGRLIGEGCHFVDVCQYLADADPQWVYCCGVHDREKTLQNQDNLTLAVRFVNGAIGVISYLSEGNPGMPKERIEVFGGNACAVLDDFRRLTLYRGRKKQVHRRGSSDKGYAQEIHALIRLALGETLPPIPIESLFYTTLVTFSAIESLRTGLPQMVSLSCLDVEE